MRRNNNVYLLSVVSLMIALMAVFAFTPIGTIQTPGFTITLMGIPLSIMACLFGPWMGAIGGAVWGSFALIQAFSGIDPTGSFLLASPEIAPSIKYSGLILMCYSRVLVGFLAGLIHDALRRVDKKGYWAPYVASLSLGILNTLFFMALFAIFFYTSEPIQQLCLERGWNPNNAFLFSLAFVGVVNMPMEWSTDLIIGGAASFGIEKASLKMHMESPLPHFFVKKELAEK